MDILEQAKLKLEQQKIEEIPSKPLKNIKTPKIIEPKQKPKKKSQKKEDTLFEIKDFLFDLATSSEFERMLYKALFGKVIRGSNELAEQKLEEGIQEFRNYIINK